MNSHDSAARGPTLRIVCVNDVYSLENLPRLRTLVERYAGVDPADRLLVTLAGDFVAPSLLSGLDAGRGMIDCMNAVGVTHVCLGNHEDDIATDALHERIAEFRGTWLSTNLVGFDNKLVGTQIIEIGRVKVGLLGVVMDDRSAYRRPPFGGATLTPPNATAMAATEMLLREQGCACVLPLTHQAVEDDRALARAQQAPAYPVILGGHDHTVFLEQLGQTWLVKAGSDAEHAIVLDLSWPAARPASCVDGIETPTVRVRREDVANYREDEPLRARVNRHMAPVHDLERATLVSLRPGETLSSVGTRLRQTSLGTLICSHLRDALGAEGCLVNGGGIRANRIYEHNFSYADVKSELPFDNDLVVATLPGAVLRDAIAASRAHAPAESGGFLQVDDRLHVDENTHTLLSVGSEPLDPARGYRIALVRDLFGGMDHQEPLLRFAQTHPEEVPPADNGREIKGVLVHAFAVELWRQLGGFDLVDANHDGVVTADEIEAALARAEKSAPSALAADLVMHALDSNSDGAVSREEATKADGE